MRTLDAVRLGTRTRLVHTKDATGAVGWLGLEEHVEPVVRSEVASHFGVCEEDVVPALSFNDDLAAESEDVFEIGRALERIFGVSIPESVLARVRTHADLVDVVMRAYGRTAGASPTPPFVRIRITRGGRPEGPWIERTGWLTPYLTETVATEAARLGESTRVDVWVAADAAWSTIVGASGRFARLSADGIRSLVHRERSGLDPSRDRAAARR